MAFREHIDFINSEYLNIEEGNSSLLNRIYDYKENWVSLKIFGEICVYAELKLSASEVSEMAVIVHLVGKTDDEPGSKVVTFSPEAALEIKKFLERELSRRCSNVLSPEVEFKSPLEIIFEEAWINCELTDGEYRHG